MLPISTSFNLCTSEVLKPTKKNSDRKHEIFVVSNSSILFDQPICLCDEDQKLFFNDIVANLDLLAGKTKRRCKQIILRMKKRGFIEFSAFSTNEVVLITVRQKSTKTNVSRTDEDETDASNYFLKIQKIQLVDLRQHLESYTNTLPVFGFNSGRYDVKLFNSYLIPYQINVKETETSVIKIAEDFLSFKIGDSQLLDFLNFFFGRSNSLKSFLKVYKTIEIKGYFP